MEFDADSALRYAKAGDELIEEAHLAEAEDMKYMRKRLNRTQKQMVAIAGGSHNAFSLRAGRRWNRLGRCGCCWTATSV